MRNDDEDEYEGVTPLSVRCGRQNQNEVPIHEIINRCWRHRNIEATDVTYNSTFSDPQNDDLRPLNYFEKLIDNSVIENLVD
jgi:hypothetical protein